MNIPRLVLACVLLVSSTPLVAQELSSSRVVLLRMSGDPGTDSSRTADLTAMSEIMSKEFTRLAGSDFTVVADDRDFTGLSDTGRKAVCIRHGARWAVFGSAYFKKDDRDLITFKLWYFDAVTGTYDSEYSQGTMRTLPFHIRRLVRGMFYLMAKETNFFIKQEGSSVPSMRKIIICEPSFNNNFQGGTFEKFRGDLISLIKKDLGDRLEIASDQAYRFLVLPPTVDYRDVKRLKRVSGLSGANWVLFAEMYQNEEKINLSLYLYNDQKGSYDSIYGEKLTSYAEAISFIDKGINDIYMRISRADGYYLHENNAVRYVREFTDFGVPESNLFQFYVYGVERDGSDLLVAAMFTVVRLDRNGAVKTVYGRRGTGRGEFQTAMKVRARGGKVYIYDSTGKMLVFRDDGSFVREFTIGTSYAGSFAIAENGSIFVPIVQDRKITLFDENGRRVRDISFPDTDTVMAVSQGEKTVTALLMHNTEYLFRDYDFTGNPVAERSIPRSDYYISAFRRDGRGNIYCLDMTKKLFFKIGAAGRVLWLKDQLDIYPTNGLNNPMDIEISAAGDEIFIADYMNRRVVKFKEFSGLAQCANETGCLAAAARLRDTDQDGYLSLLNHALYIRQDHVPALAELAGFYGRVGGYERAVGLWEQVLEIDNGNAAATAGLRKDRTRMSLRAGDVHAKQFRDTMAQVGPEAARKFYEEAVKNYELALKASPDDAGIRAKYQDLKNEYDRASGSAGPKIEIDGVSFREVFAAQYKYYSDNPVGEIRVKNATGKEIDKILAEVEVKNFMDYPTESRTLRGVKSGEEAAIKLYAVFNNKILSVTEDTPQSAQITVRYWVGDREYSASSSTSFTLYNRNALTWDQTEKLCTFITPKDPAVKVYARDVVQMFRNSRFDFMNPQLQTAIQLFDSLGVYGMTYITDPKTPFARFSKLKNQVDYVQYPRDSLRFKTGDCDDLTVLFCSLLENLGVDTCMITVPGHIFMMFNTEVPAGRRADIADAEDAVIVHEGTVWIPVETTVFGKSFLESWDSAARQYGRYRGGNGAEIVDTRKAWASFAPVTLEIAPWEPIVPARDGVERLFNNDINTIINRELARRIGFLKEKLDRSPGDSRILNSLGVAYARYGRYDDAVSFLKKAIQADGRNFAAHCNLGNVYLLRGELPAAVDCFSKAKELKPDNASVHMNMAIIYDRMKRYDDMKRSYESAIKLNGELDRHYGYLIKSQDRSRADSQTRHMPVLWVDGDQVSPGK